MGNFPLIPKMLSFSSFSGRKIVKNAFYVNGDINSIKCILTLFFPLKVENDSIFGIRGKFPIRWTPFHIINSWYALLKSLELLFGVFNLFIATINPGSTYYHRWAFSGL